MLVSRPWSSIRPSKAPIALLAITTAAAFAAPWVLIRNVKVEIPQQNEQTGQPPAAWQLPAKPWPRYVELPVAKWIGKSPHETELSPWIDTHSLPSDDNRWVIYLHSCEHCRDYLRRLYNETPVDPELVLIEILDQQERKVDLLPDTPWKAQLSADIDWVFTPPWELKLEGGVVKEAHYRGEE